MKVGLGRAFLLRTTVIVAVATALPIRGSGPVQAEIPGCGDNVSWSPGVQSGGNVTATGSFANGTTLTLVGDNVGRPEDSVGVLFAGSAWANLSGTNDAFQSGIDFDGGVVIFGASGPGTRMSIAFSAPVTNPVLFMKYLDPPRVVLRFTQVPTVLDSSPTATVSGNDVTIIGAENQENDSIAVQVNGNFEPGTPLTFTYITDPSWRRPDGDTTVITFAKVGGQCDGFGVFTGENLNGNASASPARVLSGNSSVLLASADDGYQFVSWSCTDGATLDSPTENPATLSNITADVTCTPTFEASYEIDFDRPVLDLNSGSLPEVELPDTL